MHPSKVVKGIVHTLCSTIRPLDCDDTASFIALNNDQFGVYEKFIFYKVTVNKQQHR